VTPFSVAFKYDYQGRRFEKTVNATNTTRFVYDNWNLISEISQSTNNVLTNFYVWGLDLSQTLQGAGGVGGLLGVVSKAQSLEPKAFFPCFDANGNVTDYVSTNGTIVAHFEYDPYGNITTASGLMPNAFSCRFSTKYLDSETGLSYYGFRYYNPENGRWLSKDPLGEKGGLNLYVFCGNNPVNFVDPMGLTVKGAVAAVVVEIVATLNPGSIPVVPPAIETKSTAEIIRKIAEHTAKVASTAAVIIILVLTPQTAGSAEIPRDLIDLTLPSFPTPKPGDPNFIGPIQPPSCKK